MKFLFVLVIGLIGAFTFKVQAAMGEPGSPRINIDSEKGGSPFMTPERKGAEGGKEIFTPETVRSMNKAVKPSPNRHVYQLGSKATVLTAGSVVSDEILSAVKNLFIVMQHRPFVIVVPFPGTDAIDSSAVMPKGITHLILAPTHLEDYERLVEINATYISSLEKEGGDGYAFLTRKYGTREEFSRKIDHLYRMYGMLPNPLMPLFYELPAGLYEEGDGDPHFPSSITYTILGVMNDGSREVLGDIWLANIDESDVVCYKGTSERSTMVDKKYQSMRVGQTAVGLFNSFLVADWKGKNVHIINGYSTEPAEKIDLRFDGIVAYVEPSNFKSIGNNFRSGSFCIGAINLGSEREAKPMLLFRAPSSICRPEHLVVDAQMQKEGDSENSHSKQNLKNLWGVVKHLYPSRQALDDGAWKVEERYVPTELYKQSLEKLEEEIAKFGVLAPQYSEEAIAGSPHFPKGSDRMTFSPDPRNLLFPAGDFTPGVGGK